ncbi:hypothetical protein BDZ89DRAFT_1073855, partial [Hymenopellis radicata]
RRDAGNGDGGRNDPRGARRVLPPPGRIKTREEASWEDGCTNEGFLGVAATTVDTLMAWRTDSNSHSISPLLAETIERGDCRMQQIGGVVPNPTAASKKVWTIASAWVLKVKRVHLEYLRAQSRP